jgi:hypothetical protein
MSNTRMANLKTKITRAYDEMASINFLWVQGSIHQRIEIDEAIQFIQQLKNIMTSDDTFIWDAALLLEKRWQDIKGTHLSYTCSPRAIVSRLCCDIANYLAENSDVVTSPLSILMPTIKHFKDEVSQEDISELPLKELIATHILSDNYETLIPVRLISHIELEMNLQILYVNPFTQKNLSENEISRLGNHSPQTKNIVSIYNLFQDELRNRITLYQALMNLVAGLKKGSVRQNGKENEAGVDAYEALAEFRSFWKRLTDSQKKEAYKAPQLEYLINYKFCNLAWRDECVKGTSDILQSLVTINRKILLEISSVTVTNTLTSLTTKFENNILELNRFTLSSSEDNIYQGKDGTKYLSQTRALSLYKNNSIPDAETALKLLPCLKPQDIYNLSERMYVLIAQYINSPEKLVSVLKLLDSKQLATFCYIFKYTINIYGYENNIITTWLKNLTFENFEAVVINLTPANIEMLFDTHIRSLDAQKGNMLRIFHEGYNLLPLSRHTFSSQMRLVYPKGIIFTQKSLTPYLLLLTNNFNDHKSISSLLPACEQVKYNTLVADKKSEMLIDSATDINSFGIFFNSLPEELQPFYFYKAKEKVIRFGDSVEGMLSTLSWLPEAFKPEYLSLIAPRLEQLATVNMESIAILKYVSDDMKMFHFDKLKKQLIKKTNTIQDYETIVNQLPQILTWHYTKLVMNKLCELSRNALDFKRILLLVPKEQRILYLTEILPDSPSYIGSIEEAKIIAKSLPPRSRSAFFALICTRLAALTVTEEDYLNCRDMIPQPILNSYQEQLIPRFSALTGHATTFIKMHSGFADNYGNQFYAETLKGKWRELTRNNTDFINILYTLSPSLRMEYVSQFDVKTLATECYKAPAIVFKTVYTAMSESRVDLFMEEIFSFGNNYQTFAKGSVEYDAELSQLNVPPKRKIIDKDLLNKSYSIAEMIFKTTKYQNEIQDQFINIIQKSDFLIKKIATFYKNKSLPDNRNEVGAMIKDHGKAKFINFIDSVLQTSSKHPPMFAKIKSLRFQYDHSIQILDAMKKETPAKCMDAARVVLSEKRVRYQLEKSHSFWGWLLQVLGMTKGQKILKFFDKINHQLAHEEKVRQNKNIVAIYDGIVSIPQSYRAVIKTF